MVIGAAAAAALASASGVTAGTVASGVCTAGCTVATTLGVVGVGVGLLAGTTAVPVVAVPLEPLSPPPPHAEISATQPIQANKADSRFVEALMGMR